MINSRQEAVVIALGTIFLFLGIPCCAIALIPRRENRRILGWFGVFSTMYGVRLFAEVPAAFSLFAGPYLSIASPLVWFITYLIPIPAVLFWMELTRSVLRRFFQVMAIIASAVAVAGIVAVLLNAPLMFIRYNNVTVICILLVLAVASVSPPLAKKYLMVQTPVLTVGTVILALAVIHENLRIFFPLETYPLLEPVAVAIFILSQAWVAAEKIFTDQRRLLSIENELAIAREIQNSILPSSVPQFSRLNISAAYSPMTAVAGDFYWFIAVDPHHAGFLIADVSGHGVPAALIASMIKVAMQSVTPHADDPAAVLRELQRTLSEQLRGQFVSAAYLWIDTKEHKSLYSAAGHPPLLRWQDARLQRIESNGILLGVLPDCDFPVREIPICAGDRFVLYTDGVSEPENAAGIPFGDHQFEEIIRRNQSHSAAELCDQLLTEVRQWQPRATSQEDDITLIVIDVL